VKLSIKKAIRWVWWLGNRYTVKDENNNQHFTAKGGRISLGVYDSTEKLVATLKHVGVISSHSHPRHYNIEIDGNVVCEVIHKFKVIGMNVEISGLPWVVEYDNITAEHKIKHNDEVIMTITDNVALLGESYDMEIFDAKNELICVAIVLAIDNIKR